MSEKPEEQDSERTTPERDATLDLSDDLSAEAAAPGRIGKYEIRQRIGSGGMGEVYRGYHPDLGIDVAIKFLSKEIGGGSPRFVERFYREARVAALISHPNLVRVMDCGEADGRYYLVMEYVAGETLKDRLAREGKLQWREATRIALDVARALDAALEEKVIHRDIKPANIMLDRSGRVKLADMGLAKQIGGADDTDVTMANSAIGTPAYLAPEQARDAKNVDQRADLYSLGVTLFNMLTGTPPYEGESSLEVIAKHLNDPVERPARRVPEIPRALDAAVFKLMQKEPATRFQTPAALIRELEEILATRKTVRENRVMPLVWRYWPFGAGAAVIAALLTLAFVGGRDDGKADETAEVTGRHAAITPAAEDVADFVDDLSPDAVTVPDDTPLIPKTPDAERTIPDVVPSVPPAVENEPPPAPAPTPDERPEEKPRPVPEKPVVTDDIEPGSGQPERVAKPAAPEKETPVAPRGKETPGPASGDVYTVSEIVAMEKLPDGEVRVRGKVLDTFVVNQTFVLANPSGEGEVILVKLAAGGELPETGETVTVGGRTGMQGRRYVMQAVSVAPVK